MVFDILNIVFLWSLNKFLLLIEINKTGKNIYNLWQNHNVLKIVFEEKMNQFTIVKLYYFFGATYILTGQRFLKTLFRKLKN